MAVNWRRLAPVALIGVGLIVYHNSFCGPLIFDDITSIRDNPHIRQLWPLSKALSAPPQTTAAGRPVLALSLALNYAVSGLEVWSYHAVNLAVHILAALVLYGIVRRTLQSERLRERYGDVASGLALVVALLWMVHPLQTSSVTYIIQRAESLMGLFYLLTLYCAIRGWRLAAVVACALGMGTKETMVTAPVMVLLYERVFVGGSLRELLRSRRALYGGLAAGWLLLGALMATGARRESVGFGLEGVSAWDYAWTQCGVILHYLRLAFWPQPLVLDYSWPVAKSAGEVASAAFLLGALLLATVWALWRRPRLGFLGAWFFLILAPTSSFVPIVTEVAAEHRMYLPLASVVAGMVLAVYQLPRAAAAAVIGAVVVVCSAVTVQRNEDYRSAEKIWADTISKRPGNARAHNNLGEALVGQGRLEEATAQFRAALGLEPDFAIAHYNLAEVLSMKGEREAAVVHLRQAFAMKPELAERSLGHAIALGQRGELQEAAARLSRLLGLRPDMTNAWYNMGVVLARQGRLVEALEHFETAVKLDPDFELARTALEDLRGRISQLKTTPSAGGPDRD